MVETSLLNLLAYSCIAVEQGIVTRVDAWNCLHATPQDLAILFENSIRRDNSTKIFKQKNTFYEIIPFEYSATSASGVLYIKELIIPPEHPPAFSSTDYLTGLRTRLDLLEEMDRLLKNDLIFDVIFIDLNKFKQINDHYGHSVGDDVLKEVAKRLAALHSPFFEVFRYGGDEFVALRRHDSACSFEDSEELNKLVLLFDQGISLADKTFTVSAALGYVSSHDSRDPAQLLLMADKAMYLCKKHGQQVCVKFNANQALEFKAEGELHDALRLALAENKLVQVYQPIGCAVTGKLVSCEALMRWKGDSQLYYPDFFIPLAKRAGLLRELDMWALTQAIKNLSVLKSKNIFVPVAVNLTAESLNWPDLPDFVENLLQEYKVTPRLLQLEVTESLLIENIDDTRALLERLVKKGISISLDDFGTGYSSFVYLMNLPVSKLKLDKTFVKNIKETNNYHIVKGLCQLAHTLGLTLVVEGVESQSQMDLLVQLDCDYIQGYLYSHVLDLPELEQFHNDNRAKLLP